MTLRLFLFFALSTAWACAPLSSAGAKDLPATGESGLPLPRYASLRVEPANLRTGPGTRYPIEWVFIKEGLPLQITAEFDIWRRVRDFEGAEGWLQKSALSGHRTAIVTAETAELRRAGDEASPLVAKAAKGAIGRLDSCEENWCKIVFDEVKGHIRKADIWGADPGETFD